MKIVFFGTPAYASVSLQALLESRHEIVAVVTRADAPSGRGRRLTPSPIKKLALAAGLAVLDPQKPRGAEFLDAFRKLDSDLGVVVAYGRLLPVDLLALPRKGMINAHGSLLPALRGAAPIERAILTGLQETGVSIMAVSEGMDEGDVFSRQTLPITDTTNADELREQMATLSAQMLMRTIEDIDANRATAEPQDDAAATYAPPLRREESCLDWAQPARSLSCVVRAFGPRPGAFTFDGARRLKVLEATPQKMAPHTTPEMGKMGKMGTGTILEHTAEGVVVTCGEGNLLLTMIQPEGKQAMKASDYARGRDRLTCGSQLTGAPANALA